MDPAWVIERLECNAAVLEAQLRQVRQVQAIWKPAPNKWSILEVINHLADEEIDDFRMRLSLVLKDPTMEWPPIDPDRAAIERRYNDRELAESFERFIRARAQSVEWLRSLRQTNWQTAHQHPRAGSLKAGDLLSSWLAHDLIHIRQINRLHHEYLTATAGEFSTAYAGNW